MLGLFWFLAGEERFDSLPEYGDAADAGGEDDLYENAAAAGVDISENHGKKLLVCDCVEV